MIDRLKRIYRNKFVPHRVSVFRKKWDWFQKHYDEINDSKEFFNNVHGPMTYNTDGLATSNNCDFIKDPRFKKAYQTAADTNPWPNFTLHWRIHVVCYFANLVKNLEGHYVECGVNTGAYSRAIIEYTNFNSLGKTFYLLDTYEGLVEDLVSQEEIDAGISDYIGGYPDVYEQVVKTFEPFNTKIIKGAVPATLPECDADKIAYLSIDMNCVAPEIAALHYFWDKVVSGGVVILDDYGFPMHILQKKAFDQFAKEKGVDILCLPTGQGIIIKQ